MTGIEGRLEYGVHETRFLVVSIAGKSNIRGLYLLYVHSLNPSRVKLRSDGSMMTVEYAYFTTHR